MEVTNFLLRSNQHGKDVRSTMATALIVCGVVVVVAAILVAVSVLLVMRKRSMQTTSVDTYKAFSDAAKSNGDA